MKRIMILLAALLLTVSFLAGCRKNSNTAGKTGIDDVAGKYQTVGDIKKYQWEEIQEGTDASSYFVVFRKDGTYYRAAADLPQDVYEAIFALDFSDSDYQKKYAELVSPLKIKTIENLSEKILPQNELDQWKGKTGKEMLDAGWTIWGVDTNENSYMMQSGPFLYRVYTNEKLGTMDEDLGEEVFELYTIRSVTYQGLGDATPFGE